MSENIEIIEQLLQNEKRSKQWTSLLTILLLITCATTIWFAMRNAKINKALKHEKKISDSLKNEYETLAINFDLQKQSLERQLKNLDKPNYETKFNSDFYPVPVVGVNSIGTEIKIGNGVSNGTGNGVGHSNNQGSNGTGEVRPEPARVIKVGVAPLIYIQYAEGEKFSKQNEALRNKLEALGHRPPPSEKISDFTFPYSVKYNKASDSVLAIKIRNMISEVANTKEIQVYQVKGKSPKNVIEIWLGEYRKKTIQDLKKDFIPMQQMKNKP